MARLMPPVLALALCLSAASLHAAPGEDPIILTVHVSHPTQPNLAIQRSSPMDGLTEMPAWLKAKVARFEAKAFSNTADDGSILNEKDVIARSSGEGIQRTCIQDIGSTTTDTRTTTGGPGGKQQIVVLRGNLVNICR